MENVLIIFIIILVLLVVYSDGRKNRRKHKNNREKYGEVDDDLFNDIYNDDVYNNIYTNKQKVVVKPYFFENQFNNDYRDVITALDNVVESGKPLFNRSNLPVEYTPIKKSEVKNLLKAFISTLNYNIKNKVQDFTNVGNGWLNVVPNETVESGWNRQMKELGLPEDLYNKPASRSRVKVIKIDKVEKMSTNNQVRINIYLILQKENVSDQMVLKVSFVMDKDDINNDRDFFKKDEMIDLNVHIEQTFIVGYLSDQSYGSKRPYTDFYTFENIEKDNILNQEEIFKQLRNKYEQQQIESNGLTIQFSPQTGNNIAIERLNSKNKIYP
jgi:hypothetical protein